MKKYIINYEGWHGDTAINIAEEAVEEFNKGNYKDIEDAIADEINSQIIYDDDIWEIMKDYQNPQDANYDDAMESLYEDIMSMVEEEEEEEEEDSGCPQVIDKGYALEIWHDIGPSYIFKDKDHEKYDDVKAKAAAAGMLIIEEEGENDEN